MDSEIVGAKHANIFWNRTDSAGRNWRFRANEREEIGKGCWCKLASSHYVGWHQFYWIFSPCFPEGLVWNAQLGLQVESPFHSKIEYSLENYPSKPTSTPGCLEILHCIKPLQTIPQFNNQYLRYLTLISRENSIESKTIDLILEVVLFCFNWITRQDSCAWLILADCNASAGINTSDVLETSKPDFGARPITDPAPGLVGFS